MKEEIDLRTILRYPDGDNGPDWEEYKEEDKECEDYSSCEKT